MPKRGRGPQRRAPLARTTKETVLWISALVVATALAYSNSLSAAFVNDDRDILLTDASLGKFTDLSRTLLGVPGAPSGGRPLTSLSFHLNALVAGGHPAGYRVVNIAVHLLAGIVLFLLARRLLSTASEGDRDLGGSSLPAFGVAALWLVHPLQTEAVTYISQRAESLMGLFFLLTVYCAVRAFDEPNPKGWYRLAAVACVASVLAKEVGVVAPLVVLLYDRVRVSGSFRTALKRHRTLYLALGFSWLVATALQATSPRGYSVGFSDVAVTPLGYLARQVVAVPMYLKLVIWPAPLVFDYGFPPPAPQPWLVVVGTVALAGLVIASLLAVRGRQLAGFAGVSFFLILAPTSTVIPILTEVVAEHRMYLPLACVLGVVVAAEAAAARAAVSRGWVPRVVAGVAVGVLLLAAGVTFGVLTRQRNAVYRSELSLWQDTASKVPNNPRAQSNLGMAYLTAGDAQAAVERFRVAVGLRASYFEANANLALGLERSGKFDEALIYFKQAVALDPTNPTAETELVRVLVKLGQWDAALAAGKAYVEAAPDRPEANALYASLLAKRGRSVEAQSFRQRARELSHTR